MPFGGLLSAGISAGGGLLSSFLGGNAAKKAAQQQRQAGIDAANQVNATSASTGKNIGEQASQAEGGLGTAVSQAIPAEQEAANQANKGIGDTAERIQQNLNPYTSAGTTSTQRLLDMAGDNGPLSKQFSFNPSDLSSDPGYAFTLKQGQDAIQRSAAANGGLFGTGTLKSLAGYTTGSANQYFNDAYQRALSTFNTNRQGALAQISTLQNLAGTGYNATAGGNTALQTSSLAQSGNTTNAANLGGSQLLNAATQQGNWGVQSGIAAGQLADQAAVNAGNFSTGASNAQANGTLAGGRANQSMVSTVSDLLSQIVKGKTNTGNNGSIVSNTGGDYPMSE